ncbi:hypothetical protein FOA52_011237 [Chlamydomonas sp. UWO 241]|nr:hypothetical protein FOA52_011237 [Chlamydomonas sp. UWO 241]
MTVTSPGVIPTGARCAYVTPQLTLVLNSLGDIYVGPFCTESGLGRSYTGSIQFFSQDAVTKFSNLVVSATPFVVQLLAIPCGAAVDISSPGLSTTLSCPSTPALCCAGLQLPPPPPPVPPPPPPPTDIGPGLFQLTVTSPTFIPVGARCVFVSQQLTFLLSTLGDPYAGPFCSETAFTYSSSVQFFSADAIRRFSSFVTASTPVFAQLLAVPCGSSISVAYPGLATLLACPTSPSLCCAGQVPPKPPPPPVPPPPPPSPPPTGVPNLLQFTVDNPSPIPLDARCAYVTTQLVLLLNAMGDAYVGPFCSDNFRSYTVSIQFPSLDAMWRFSNFVTTTTNLFVPRMPHLTRPMLRNRAAPAAAAAPPSASPPLAAAPTPNTRYYLPPPPPGGAPPLSFAHKRYLVSLTPGVLSGLHVDEAFVRNYLCRDMRVAGERMFDQLHLFRGIDWEWDIDTAGGMCTVTNGGPSRDYGWFYKIAFTTATRTSASLVAAYLMDMATFEPFVGYSHLLCGADFRLEMDKLGSPGSREQVVYQAPPPRGVAWPLDLADLFAPCQRTPYPYANRKACLA